MHLANRNDSVRVNSRRRRNEFERKYLSIVVLVKETAKLRLQHKRIRASTYRYVYILTLLCTSRAWESSMKRELRLQEQHVTASTYRVRQILEERELYILYKIDVEKKNC